MTSPNLENLARANQLKPEAPGKREIEGLVASGRARLNDAQLASLALESRFDLAYNAAHALALAALRLRGYRSDKRYLVFQCVELTLGMSRSDCRTLALCHDRRNLAEYEGHAEIDEQLLRDLVAIAGRMLGLLEALSPPGPRAGPAPG